MILLDTNHISVIKYKDSVAYHQLMANMRTSVDQDFVTSIITAEEQMRGWLAIIHKTSDAEKQVGHYAKLGELFVFFQKWRLLPFDVASAKTFKFLRSEGVRIGNKDLKIASIALTHSLLLLTANTRDFSQVPRLRFEDWTV